jgi:hypothetical protein
MNRPYALSLQACHEQIARKARELDDRQLRLTGSTLWEAPMTDQDRAREICARASLAAADGASVDLIAACGAQVYAWLRAKDAEEQMRIDTGDAA